MVVADDDDGVRVACEVALEPERRLEVDPAVGQRYAWLVDLPDAGVTKLLERDVYGALDRRPDLVRTWAGDIGGILHRDYIWHDLAQAWQTPDVGEQVVEGMTSPGQAEKTTRYEGLGLPTPIAEQLAGELDAEMGRCILRLYRTGAGYTVTLVSQPMDADRYVDTHPFEGVAICAVTAGIS